MTEPTKNRYRNIKMALISVLIAGGATIAVGLFALDRMGAGVSRQGWLLKEYLLGSEPVGIFREDDIYGWTHIPSSVGRQRVVPDYDAVYHIDSLGYRHVPNAPPLDTPQILFLGGSFTFGQGVEDSEPFPAVLQRAWPNIRVVNAGVNGWGTAQAFLKLNNEFARNNQIVMVVYGFITHHMKRNYLRKQWLDQLTSLSNRRNPFFELSNNNRLIFQGLADPERDGLPNSLELSEREALMTEKFIMLMAKRCAERRIPFVVVILPDGTQNYGASIVKRGAGNQSVIDLRPLLDHNKIHYTYDIHLHPEGHREVAAILRPLLEGRMAHLGGRE